MLAEDRKRTTAFTAGQKERLRAMQQYASTVAREERKATQEHAREQQRRTRTEQQAQRDRANALRDRSSAWGSRASQFASYAMGTGSTLHGQIQDARTRRAQNESSLNDTLLQLVPSGAGEGEVRAMQARVQAFVRSGRMDMGAVVGALGGAQSRFNALGAASPEARMGALNQTLEDIGFANVISPSDLNGIPQFSAMLRQQGVSDGMRTEILRNTTGISFAGSVETQQAIEQGLPSMLNSLSRTMATAGPNANRDGLIRDSISDFMAQIQTNAASGGRVGVSGNRANTLRTALNSTDTQNRLGNALSQRRMTDEQRAVFGRSFTRGRDGRYVMAEGLRNSPSEAAAMFGGLFNNDPTAVANFLGPRGGGGRRQLLNRPEASLLTSYFANGQDSQGRTVRQYEAVRDLKRQTITADQFETMRRVRAGEERNVLQDEENNRVAALSDNTNAIVRLSNALSGFQSSNPMLSTALGAGAAALLPAAGGSVGAAAAGGTALTAAAGGGAAAVGASIAGVLAASGVGLLLGDQIAQRMQAGGYDYTGVQGMEGVQVRRAGTEAQIESVFSGETWAELGRALGLGFNSTANSPQATVHARAVAATGANSVAPESRANR